MCWYKIVAELWTLEFTFFGGYVVCVSGANGFTLRFSDVHLVTAIQRLSLRFDLDFPI